MVVVVAVVAAAAVISGSVVVAAYSSFRGETKSPLTIVRIFLWEIEVESFFFFLGGRGRGRMQVVCMLQDSWPFADECHSRSGKPRHLSVRSGAGSFGMVMVLFVSSFCSISVQEEFIWYVRCKRLA